MSILECPLPVDGLAILAEFLGFSDAATEDEEIDSNPLKASETSLLNRRSALDSTNSRNLFALAASCENVLSRARNLVARTAAIAHDLSAAKINGVSLHSSSAAKTGYTVNDSINSAWHSSLLKVMEERDEAHSQMIASKVLHSHEMERQRKTMTQTMIELERYKAIAQQGNSNPANGEVAIPFSSGHTMHNSDEELVLLCQQLAGEISARTSSEMEILRMKEIRLTEREAETAEQNIMIEEMQRLQASLSEERTRAEAATEELETWKRSCKALMSADDSTTTKRIDGIDIHRDL
jgi:hypothetical protein